MSVDINVDTSVVLDQINEDEVIAFYGEGALLDAIGIEEAKAHFDLQEVEDVAE